MIRRWVHAFIDAVDDWADGMFLRAHSPDWFLLEADGVMACRLCGEPWPCRDAEQARRQMNARRARRAGR